VLVLAALALAEDSTFEGARATPSRAGREAHASAEMGAMLAFGNTESMTLTGQGTLSYRWGQDQLSGSFGVNWGQSRQDADADGKLSDAERAAPYVQTAEREQATVRYDRFLGKKDSIYALAGGFSDTFAGYDWRVNGQVGESHLFVSTQATTLRAELGLDVARENFVEGVDPGAQTVLSGRALVGVRHQFNGHVVLENNLELYESLLAVSDVRVNNIAAVTASLDKRVALKLSHQLAFDNVPVEGYQPLDHTTLATVVFTVL